jgi:hypothetical protein
MSVSIANTDAGLSGKTLDLLESDQTITGQKTFDRDPNPPFAVSSGSAKVSNLDADLLDGQEGSYYLDPTNLSAAVPATKGGTGSTSTPSNGQLLIGNGTGFTAASPSLTGITATTGAGTLALSANSRAITQTTTNTGPSNSAVESSLFSTTITGGSLSTTKVAHFVQRGNITTDAGGARNVNFQVKFGGTSLCGNSNLALSANSTYDYLLEVWLSPYNNTSTAVQVFARLTLVNTATASTWIADNTVKVQTACKANIAVTHSSDQTFAVTATLDTAASGFALTAFSQSLFLV